MGCISSGIEKIPVEPEPKKKGDVGQGEGKF